MYINVLSESIQQIFLLPNCHINLFHMTFSAVLLLNELVSWFMDESPIQEG